MGSGLVVEVAVGGDGGAVRGGEVWGEVEDGGDEVVDVGEVVPGGDGGGDAGGLRLQLVVDEGAHAQG